jgi:DNA-binding IclR family transcriptional regulator
MATVPAVSSRTLVRGLSILEIVASTPGGIGVTSVAEAADLDKGTASRLLATLRQLGYVQQRGADRHYVLGSRCLWLANRYQIGQEELTAQARPYLIELRDRTRETVHLAIREGNNMVYIAQEEPDRSVHVRSAVGSRMPLHKTAMGRAILAAMPDEPREQLLEQISASVEASGDTVDLAEIRSDIADAGVRGWAAVDRHDDVTRIAAAIVDTEGEPIGAITLSGPSYRIDGNAEELGADVVRIARGLSQALAI